MTSETKGKPLFSLAESYQIAVLALRTVPFMVRGEKRGLLTFRLRERLMMAVTEVNGCAMCSWYHVHVALKAGMDADEIKHILTGEYTGVPQEETTAVLFAQHYADTRGRPDPAAWDALCVQYGKAAALAMLGAVRGIMLGNAIGIPAGSFLNRLGVKRFRRDSRSTLAYELAMLLSGIVFLPAAALHALAAWVFRVSIEP